MLTRLYTYLTDLDMYETNQIILTQPKLEISIPPVANGIHHQVSIHIRPEKVLKKGSKHTKTRADWAS